MNNSILIIAAIVIVSFSSLFSSISATSGGLASYSFYSDPSSSTQLPIESTDDVSTDDVSDSESSTPSPTTPVPTYLTWTKKPQNIVSGGNYQICRASHGGHTNPGKVHRGRCHFGWGGLEHHTDNFEYLDSTKSLQWSSTKSNPVSGGNYLVCRANHSGQTNPGKVHIGRCHFGWGGRELHTDTFEYLNQDS